MIIFAMAAGLGVAISDVFVSKESLILVTIALILLVPILRRIVRRQFDVFEPIVLFGISYGVMFIVRPAAMLFTDDLMYKRPSQTIDISSAFTEMLAIALLGAVAFVFAYSLPVGRRVAFKLKGPPTNFHIDTAVTAALIIAFGGILSFLWFLVSTGSIEALGLLLTGRSLELTEAVRRSSAYVWHGPLLLVPASLILWGIGRTRRNNFLVIIALFVIGVLLLRAAPHGSRMVLFPFFCGLVVYYYAAKMSRPRLLTVLTLAVITLILSTFFQFFRSSQFRQDAGVWGVLSHSVNPYQWLEPLAVGEDAAMAPLLAVALQNIPEQFPYAYGGATFGDLLIRPIPRQIWVGKPLSPRESLVSTLWPIEYRSGTVNPEFSVLLYFYLDLWVVGVAIGMAAYGILARGLYEYFRMHQTDVTVQLLFSVTLPFLVIALRDSPVDTLVRAIFMVLPIWIIFQIAAAKSMAGSVRPAPYRFL
jgi:hypothetical protein